ncbi:uncharacterized protein [Dysidea avara]|uniref:uncharacterized protein isoform X1 n=2 Tax=Dysidea avara TaxID=196820 RepID=UPI003321A34D
MDTTIEFDPKKTAFVLGPGINRLCLTTNNSDFRDDIPVDYKAVCEEGIKYAMRFVDSRECSNKHRLLQNACELNPMYAAHEVTAILRRNGVYDSWLSSLHNKVNSLSRQTMYAKHYALQFLSAMNQKGALLATTCHTEVLEQALGLKSVSLTQNDVTSKVLGHGGWPNSLLHIYGMFSQPETVVFDFLAHDANNSMSTEGKAVLTVFLQRNLFFVGFSNNHFDKTAEKFIELISPQLSQPGSMRPVFISSVQNDNNPLLDNFMKVYYSDQMSLSLFHQILYASGTNTDEPNFMKRFCIDNVSQISSNSSSSTTSNFDTVLSLIIHEKDTVIGSILSTIGRGSTMRPESISYGSKVGQLRQVVIRFNISGALKLSHLILANQLNLVTCDVVAFQLEGGPLVWIQNRSQIARYLTTTNKGEILAKSLTSSISVEDIPAMQPRPFVSSPPPLLAINSTAKVPTKPELTLSPKVSEIMQKKASQTKPSGKLSPLTIPPSPISPDPRSSVSPFSSASTPVKYLSVVSGKLRAGLPEELDPYHTIECYERLTNKVIPMHASMIGCTASASDKELNRSTQEVPVIASSVSPLLSSSAVQAAVGIGMSMKPQPDNSPKVPIQTIKLTHKYQENKHSRQPKKHSDTSSPNDSRSHSNSPSNGNSTGDVSVVGIPSSAKNEVTTPAGKSPLATHSMFNTAIAAAAGLPAIPQPFPLPIMFHPTFTPTTPGTQLPFVYPSLTPLGMSSPLSTLQQFPMLQQSHPNPYMMVDCPTFVWPPSSKVAGAGFSFMMPNSSVLQTPPSSALQENSNSQTRKRCTPPPVVEGNSQVTPIIPEPSPKKARPDFASTSSSSHLPQVTTLSSATLSTIPAASITRHSNIPIVSQEMDTIHKLITDDGSSSESEMKDNGDSDSEDDVVTCPQEPAPIEGTNNLPPFPNGRGVVQLWQFLLDMLLTPDKSFMIQWTGNEYEFTILQPDDVAAMWGECKGKPRMNYDKLSRGLRYYYSKGIMDKVPGKKLTFKFTCNVEDYVRTRSRNPNAVQTLRAIIRNSKLNHISSSDLPYNTPNTLTLTTTPQ